MAKKIKKPKSPKRSSPVKAKASKKTVKPVKKTAPKAKAKPKVKAKKVAARKPAVKKTVAIKPVRAAKPTRLVRVGGFPDQLLDAALKVLDDRQAEDVVTFNLAGRSAIADYLIVASGRAARQTAAIADYLRDAFEKLGARNIRVEGMAEGNWVLVDAGDVVVHLFRPEVRRYYHLEDIWSENPKNPAK